MFRSTLSEVYYRGQLPLRGGRAIGTSIQRGQRVDRGAMPGVGLGINKRALIFSSLGPFFALSAAESPEMKILRVVRPIKKRV